MIASLPSIRVICSSILRVCSLLPWRLYLLGVSCSGGRQAVHIIILETFLALHKRVLRLETVVGGPHLTCLFQMNLSHMGEYRILLRLIHWVLSRGLRKCQSVSACYCSHVDMCLLSLLPVSARVTARTPIYCGPCKASGSEMRDEHKGVDSNALCFLYIDIVCSR